MFHFNRKMAIVSRSDHLKFAILQNLLLFVVELRTNVNAGEIRGGDGLLLLGFAFVS